MSGRGEYGANISVGIEYVLSCQRPDGTFSLQAPEPTFTDYSFAHTTIYNHAICSLMLTEAYGMVDAATSVRLRGAIEKAKTFTLNLQMGPKARAVDLGGWRYVRIPNDVCSDPPVTSWQLLFLRSAKNAGFDVPADRIAMAVDYMKRNFDPRAGTFQYYSGRNVPLTRGTAGAGILTLSLGGQHATPEAKSAADWILAHPFVPYRNQVSTNDRYFYALFYCTTALFQLGGKHWILFYPQTARVLVANQRPDGSWDADPHGGDRMFGNSYTTALACLALNTPKQLLPIFQR